MWQLSWLGDKVATELGCLRGWCNWLLDRRVRWDQFGLVKCGNYMIASVLIDNGSSLNVMPKTTLDKLYSPSAILRNSLVAIKAFDDSKREVMGEITLSIRIGPTTFDITF
ncbi:hypothetical protein CR513_37867, partial [Mucuna pruriens]